MTIENIYKEIDTLMNRIEGDDAVEEVKREYVAYDKKAKLLLNSKDIESYLSNYEEMYTKDIAIIECFGSTSSKELREYIDDKNINFDDLKIETVKALRIAIEFLIYEAEDEEY